MQVRLMLIGILIFVSLLMKAQPRIVKPVKTRPKTTGLYFGAGMGRSVLFLERNVKENNDAGGYYFTAQYGGSRLFRVSAEFTHYKKINFAPTWYNIKANTTEVNLHVIARFEQANAFFYPIVGISYNQFNGFFTGKDDFLNLTLKHPANTYVSTNWIGLNAGTGFEIYYKRLGFFIEYKMRVGANNGVDKRVNIMDVCYSFGLKCDLRVPSIYSIVKGTRNRYFLNAD